MVWIKRKQDEHVCPMPSLFEEGVWPGDIWECDDCKLRWKVNEHQIDGLYWQQIAVPTQE
jgi:hypothetical protein